MSFGMPPQVRLVSVDVGYTLGEPEGVSFTQRLSSLSALPAEQSKRVVQQHLHAAAPDDEEAVGAVCRQLGITRSDFPRTHRPASFTVWPGSSEALARIAAVVPVVTLSNVTYWDDQGCDVRALFAPHVRAHYPSWRVGFAKPDPRAVQTVARLHGVLPAEVLHVGDSYVYDVLGARAAGAQALWVRDRRSPSAPPPQPAGPTPWVTAVAGLSAAADHVVQTVLTRPLTARSPAP
ncbi:HAD family hydrolase [Streptomyces sp. NPDC051561]|uniref:HAD family hydrolase n=1 Tax=Streptomyces sp. NPDC051561 TaxID=3365658 RepID=UPI0037A03ABC